MPLMPLAQAFAAQGHDVVIASGADAAETARGRGLSFRETGPPFGEWFGALRARTRGMPGDGLPPDRVERYFLPRLFGEVGTALVVDDLTKAVTEFEPQLLMFDPVMFAGPLVAARFGVSALQHTVGPLNAPSTLELVADAVGPIWREFGLDVPPAAGMYDGATVAICPPSLDPAAGEQPRIVALRPVDLPRADPPPLPLSRDFPDPDRPLVYVTLGTFSNTNLEIWRLLLDALSQEPVNVFATVGRDNDPSSLAIPDNVRLAQFVPQGDVLPHCAAAIHHAGAGTVFGILAHRLPSVALPQSADNFTIAERLASAGAAQALQPTEVTVDGVRTALRTVMASAAHRSAAGQLADEIAAMPTPAQAAATITDQIGRAIH